MTTATQPAITQTMTYDPHKFRELLLYIAERSEDDPNFGKTKLNKILFYTDFLAYGIFGRSVTGATYQRRDYGPVPQELPAARRKLIDDGDAAIDYGRRFNYPQERLVAKRPANPSVLTPGERRLVDDVIRELWHHSAVAVSDLSHREVGWKIADDREVIPYNTVFLSSRKLTPTDIAHGQFYAENRQAESVALSA